MKMMGHDEFIIHQRRANFASDRRDWHRLPVEGTVAYNGKPRIIGNALTHIGLWSGILCLLWMAGRIALSMIGA